MKYLAFILLGLLILACENEPTSPLLLGPSETGILVLNEGLFGQSNAGFTYYNISDQKVTENPYFAANGVKLGDTGNDMEILDGKIYACVSNSNKIEVISLPDYKSLGFVDLGENGSPREIVVIDSATAYVTSLYKNSVIKIDPASFTVKKEIPVGKYPEGLTYSNGKLFAANSNFSDGNTISIIDISIDEVIEEIKVGYNPRIMFTTPDNTVYAVCTGKYDATGRGGLYKINPESGIVIDSLIIEQNPGEATFNGNEYAYIVKNSGVVKVNLADLSIPVDSNPFIPAAEINSSYGVIYSLYFEQNSKTLYAGNPNDFVQNGSILMFNTAGEKTGEFTCGLNPGTILYFELY